MGGRGRIATERATFLRNGNTLTQLVEQSQSTHMVRNCAQYL
jgi:hypothetical protein